MDVVDDLAKDARGACGGREGRGYEGGMRGVWGACGVCVGGWGVGLGRVGWGGVRRRVGSGWGMGERGCRVGSGGGVGQGRVGV